MRGSAEQPQLYSLLYLIYSLPPTLNNQYLLIMFCFLLLKPRSISITYKPFFLLPIYGFIYTAFRILLLIQYICHTASWLFPCTCHSFSSFSFHMEFHLEFEISEELFRSSSSSLSGSGHCKTTFFIWVDVFLCWLVSFKNYFQNGVSIC